MQATFTDLVGTADLPAHCFHRDELTNLVPALDMTAGVDDTEALASAAVATAANMTCSVGCSL